jgi:flavin-dependent dehydrogenase
LVEILKDLIIAGLGVSGSTLAYALSNKGFKITAYDPIKKYNKACGEQITGTKNTLNLIKKSDSIVTIPNYFSIYVNNKEKANINFGGSSPWYIVNKSKFVQYLRESSISNGVEVIYRNWKNERGIITVDARGPFSGSLKNKILVKRYILKTEWDPNHVILDFRPNEGGLYWIFPADNDGRLVNTGGGFVNLWNDEALSKSIIEYAKLNLKNFEIIDVKAAPLDVFSQYKHYSDNMFYVGEAAGLVLAISGEGNRPAIESSYALSDAIVKYALEINDVKNYYLKLSKKIVNDSILSRKLFTFTYKYRKSIDMVNVLNNIPKWFWYKYLSVNLEINDLIKLGSDLNFILSVIKGIKY